MNREKLAHYISPLLFIFSGLLAFASISYAEGVCPPQLINRKIAVIVGSASLDATPELVKDVTALIEGECANRGLNPVDQTVLQKILPEQEKLLILRGNTVGAITLGEKLGADLLMVGQLRVKGRVIRGLNTSIKSVYVTLTLKILDAKTARLISSVSWSKKTGGVDVVQRAYDILEENITGIMDNLYSQYCKRGLNILESGHTTLTEKGKGHSVPSAGNQQNNSDSPPPPSSTKLEDL
ncbi:MAG: hypothetical protein JRI45_01810 [Deltaproteobacteria bacterium]|nr:hypothetical protein [Deltaproteobacteria bacterium]MBW2067328.1 hypothetical protein [Deltaproteobacteria bacterium]